MAERSKLEDLIDRLRGIYRVPITDGLGAVGGGEEPDNPKEFVRRFEPTWINLLAAAEIEALCAALKPFCCAENNMDSDTPDDADIEIYDGVTAGDLRRARRAMEGGAAVDSIAPKGGANDPR